MTNDNLWMVQEQTPPATHGSSNYLIFIAPGGKEVLRFESDGKVFVRGEQAGYAKDILDGLRDFLRQCNCLPTGTPEEPKT